MRHIPKGNAAKLVITGGVVLAMVVVITSGFIVHQMRSRGQSTATKTINFDLDHQTYPDVSSLAQASGLIIRGTVLDNGTTTQAAPAGTAPDGYEIPGIPQTDFSVMVDRVIKGTWPAANTITVSLTGGTLQATRYTSPGMPWLSKGQQAVFFLKPGNDGKYYPLAGGATIASTNANHIFTLPAAVSGSQTLDLPQSMQQ